MHFTEPSNDPNADAELGQTAVNAAARVVLGDDEPDTNGKTNVFGGASYPGKKVGNMATDPDPDGVLRRFPYSISRLTDFAVVAARAGGHEVSPTTFGGGRAWVTYLGPNGTVPTVSFVDVLRGRHAGIAGADLVVGATATDLQDIHATPSSPAMSAPSTRRRRSRRYSMGCR